MSIAMQDYEGSSLDFVRGKDRTVSVRRVEANRRNARKSTGPRTAEGKKRASRNSMKHGLCALYAHLPSECGATFNTFIGELEEELQPRTPLQHMVFEQIANLAWRLQRLPEAQSKIFTEEMRFIETDDDTPLSPSDVLARRFSDSPGQNAFALMERYERGMRNALFRFFRQFDHLKKHRATVPYGEETRGQVLYPERAVGSYPPESERARDEEPIEYSPEGQEAAIAGAAPSFTAVPNVGRKDAIAPSQGEAPTPVCAALTPEVSGHNVVTVPAKRSQTNPPPIVDSASPAKKCAVETRSPVTERSQFTVPPTGDRDGFNASATSNPVAPPRQQPPPNRSLG